MFESSREWIHGKCCIDSNEFMYVTKGAVCIEDGGVEHCIKEKVVLVLERGKTHKGAVVTEGVGFLWFHIIGDFE